MITELAAGEERVFSHLFKTTIKNYVPDETSLVFHLEVVSEHNSFHKTIEVVSQAPKLAITQAAISNVSGAKVIEPGDEINIEFELLNIGHNAIFDVSAAASANFSGVEILGNKRMIDKIEVGESVSVSFRGKIGKYVEAGNIIFFYISAFKGTYATESTVAMIVGNLIEDFETGDFSRFNWEQGANPWEITASNVYKGKFCARSKMNLDHNSASQLKISTIVPLASTVSYARKVSSEAGFDFFNFYIDDRLMEHLSGTTSDWETATFDVKSGEHTFTFEYSKDLFISEGEDCAWIDNVSIPGMGKLVTEDLPKIEVISYTVNNLPAKNYVVTGAANIKFDLKNTGFANAYNVTGELSCSLPELLIFAEYSTHNQTLPFSIEKNGEISVNFELKPMLLRDLEREFVEFVLAVKSDGNIIYYPFVLEFAQLSSALPGTSMLVFPNPVHTTLTVIAETPIASCQIIDMKGSVVSSQQNINNYKAQINVTSLAAGIYFIKMMETSHRTSIQKFIKQ
jgi:hypothetical protein